MSEGNIIHRSPANIRICPPGTDHVGEDQLISGSSSSRFFESLIRDARPFFGSQLRDQRPAFESTTRTEEKISHRTINGLKRKRGEYSSGGCIGVALTRDCRPLQLTIFKSILDHVDQAEILWNYSTES